MVSFPTDLGWDRPSPLGPKLTIKDSGLRLLGATIARELAHFLAQSGLPGGAVCTASIPSVHVPLLMG